MRLIGNWWVSPSSLIDDTHTPSSSSSISPCFLIKTQTHTQNTEATVSAVCSERKILARHRLLLLGFFHWIDFGTTLQRSPRFSSFFFFSSLSCQSLLQPLYVYVAFLPCSSATTSSHQLSQRQFSLSQLSHSVVGRCQENQSLSLPLWLIKKCVSFSSHWVMYWTSTSSAVSVRRSPWQLGNYKFVSFYIENKK